MGYDFVSPMKFRMKPSVYTNDILKEAIEDAKAVRATALANAHFALNEAFKPTTIDVWEQKVKKQIDDRMFNSTFNGDINDPLTLESIIEDLERDFNKNSRNKVIVKKVKQQSDDSEQIPDEKPQEYTLVGAKKVFKENS